MDNDQAGKAGAGERNRTLDLRITNALLYQLSYTGNAVMIKEGLLAPKCAGPEEPLAFCRCLVR